MTPYEIPLSPSQQTFTIELDGQKYRMTVRWCQPANCWMLDLSSTDDVPILQGVPVVTSEDLLQQYGYLGIGGQLVAQTDHDPSAVPTYENLGTTSHLYFVK